MSAQPLTEAELERDLMRQCDICGVNRVNFDADGIGFAHTCYGAKRYALSRYPGEHRIVLAPHDGSYVLASEYAPLRDEVKALKAQLERIKTIALYPPRDAAILRILNEGIPPIDTPKGEADK